MKGIALQGGGIAGIGHAGALQILQEMGELHDTTVFIGASVGSIVAAALACRISIESITMEMLNVDFSQFKDGSFGYLPDVYRLFNNFGWYKGDALEKWVGELLVRYTNIGVNITFEEVYEKFGTILEMPVTNVTTSQTEYLNYKTTPNLPVKTGVRRSAGLPIFFQADQDSNENMYIDGGLLDNYPIERLYTYGLKPSEVVGIKLITSESLQKIKHTPPKNLEEFLYTVFNMTRNQALKTHINTKDWERTIAIDTGILSITDFGLSLQQKEELLSRGREGATKFFEKQK